MRGWWVDIDAQVRHLVFLPGLLYSDASCVNAHLFHLGLSQNFIFGLPMVLSSTTLIALVFYYVLPNEDWSFNLCMTAGAILSATDLVVVRAVLNTVRMLKVESEAFHVSYYCDLKVREH